MSHKTNKAIAIVMLILVAVLFGECARFVAGIDYVDAAAAPSPTRKPIKTPTSAPTETPGPPKPTDAPEFENPVFLPIIVNGQAPGHDYPEIENCRIVASPMEDLVDMCCGLYGMLCEFEQPKCLVEPCPVKLVTVIPPTEYRPTSAPTETPVWKVEPTGWVRPAVTPTPNYKTPIPTDWVTPTPVGLDCPDGWEEIWGTDHGPICVPVYPPIDDENYQYCLEYAEYGEDGIWFYCCHEFGLFCEPPPPDPPCPDGYVDVDGKCFRGWFEPDECYPDGYIIFNYEDPPVAACYWPGE